MRHDDFDFWFQDVKNLTGAPRLRPSDIWRGDDTWHDAFLECLTPEEAINDASLSDVSRTPDRSKRKPARFQRVAIVSLSRIRRTVSARISAYLAAAEAPHLSLLGRPL